MVKNLDDKNAAEISLIENVQRENLNPVEEAEGYENLMKKFVSSKLMTKMFKDLVNFAKNAHFTHKTDLFCYGIYGNGLIENLKSLLKPEDTMFINTTLKPKEKLTVLSTSKEHKPIIDIFNGKFADEKDITDIIFHGHNESANKTIEFGVDSNNKLFLTRTSNQGAGVFFKEVLLTSEEL